MSHMNSDNRSAIAETAQGAANSDESSLLQQLQAGEDAAYHELVRLYGGRLLAVARRLMRNEEDARDCLQDAFLSAFRSIDRFEAKSQLGTWLHRIVVNACLMKLRSRKRKPEELVDPQTSEFDDYGFRIGPCEMGRTSTDDLFEQKEVREQVRSAINDLPDNYRIVLVLRDIEELDTAETAEMLGMTPGAVKVRLHRARLALREQIGSLFE
jgi:RNA polymerase sigma-70 factor (ECF subfamily)